MGGARLPSNQNIDKLSRNWEFVFLMRKANSIAFCGVKFGPYRG